MLLGGTQMGVAMVLTVVVMLMLIVELMVVVMGPIVASEVGIWEW